MQIVDKDGNIFGNGLEVTGPDGKPKTTGGGGGSPTGPAGGDLFGTYPNPGVVWTNGIPTYDLQYYPLSLNPAGYLTSLTALDITTALGYTPYSNTNPAGYIDSSALLPYLTAVTAASTYYPLTNPNAYISGITSSMVTTALGYTPYNSTNPSGYITSSALSGYLTSATAAATYYPLTNPNSYISGITGSMVTTALGYIPYNSANPANYITSVELAPYLTSVDAALTYYPLSNPSGYINGISSSDVITALGFTPYDSTNPAGYIDVSALSPYLKSSVAASTYYPLTNPSNYISNITGSMVTTALGYVPYDSANPDAYITADALTPYLTIADAEVKYYPVTNPSSYISGITSADVTTALGYIPYSNSNPTGYITSSALGPYLTAATAASTYQPTLSLTTAGTSGAATLVGSTLNIPQYSSGSGGAAVIDIQTFTSSGVWTKPTNAKQVEVFLFGAGGGGGSGRRGAAATARYGGGGAATGSVVINKMDASVLSATENIWIGTGATGALGTAVNDTNGTNGGTGGTSYLGGSGTAATAKLIAPGGAGGVGGTNTANASGNAASQLIYGVYASNNYGSTSSNASAFTVISTFNMRPITSGVYGGGIDTANVRYSGASIQNRKMDLSTLFYLTSGGVAAGAAGGNGTLSLTDPHFPILSSGGAGGAAGDTAGTVAGGKGGNGAMCAGGGGGGASANGAVSGAGGTGGNGYCIIITYF